VQPDAALVKAVKSGRQEAYADLVARYERPVKAAALRVLGNYHDAQDAAQEAFVTAYRRLGELRDEAAFGAWLLVIARREALRLAQRPRPSALTPADAATESGDRIDEVSERLLAAMDRLPEAERLVVYLVYFGGQSVAEASQATGRPVGTVTKQLSRGRQRLREMIEETTHGQL
jgi:RNA polymerase sigma-70 factor, ECF subfamily